MKRVDTNTVVAVAALLTSVVAVWVAFDESRVQRRSQRASFMPILEVEASLQGSSDAHAASASIYVRNAGTGVAFIESAELQIDGEAVDDYQTLATALFSPPLAALADLSWETLRGYIRPEETKSALVFRWPPTDAARSLFQAYMGSDLGANVERFTLRLCYCSVFDECWRSSSGSVDRPRPVASCGEPRDAIEGIWQSYYELRAREARDNGPPPAGAPGLPTAGPTSPPDRDGADRSP